MGEMTRDEIDARFASMRAEMNAGFAEVRIEIQKSVADIVKWVVGTVMGAAAAAITVMTFVLNNAIPKPPAPVPITASAPAAPVNVYINPASAPSSPAPR
jgi:hypothetical protein